jgi:hypothetical protein
MIMDDRKAYFSVTHDPCNWEARGMHLLIRVPNWLGGARVVQWLMRPRQRWILRALLWLRT